MAFPAVAIKIAVASPGDTGEERECAREVIYRWNVLHAESYELVLMPTGWETHATPAMGKQAQDIINEDVIDDADILIGIFGARLGTPTANAPSGTVEEIRRHVESGKPAMVYFSSKDIARDELDVNQIAALKEFEKECRDNGLIDYFANSDEFREKLDRHLTQTVNRRLLKKLAISGGQKTSSDPILSDDAKELLVAAGLDSEGQIYTYAAEGGFSSVRIGDKSFGEDENPRSIARWQAALQEIVHSGLTQSSVVNTLNYLNNAGFQMADKLNASSDAE